MFHYFFNRTPKQRTREEIELRLAEERLRIKDMEFQMKKFSHQNSCGENFPLELKYKNSIAHLMEQKKGFLENLNQVPNALLL